jgi:hypothetical protein
MEHGTHHHRRHKRVSYAERKILIFVIPGTFLVAVLISLLVTGFPKLIRTMVRNAKKETDLSIEFIRGSAVRRETKNRVSYEEQFRKLHEGEWEDSYQEILQNTRDNEIENLEKQFDKELKK